MKTMTGVSKNRHGTYYAVKKVPKGLEEATAQSLGNGKLRQVFLKRSLGTKDLRVANIRAKPVLMEFDRIFAQAEALTVERPLRTSLQKREIEQIASYFLAHQLAADDENRREGGSEATFQDIARQLTSHGVEYDTAYAVGDAPPIGLSDREMHRRAETLAWTLQPTRQALARGDFSMLRWEMDELLDLFRINLDPASASYRELGMAILRAHVKTLEAVERRDRGEVVEAPEPVDPQFAAASSVATLKASYEGWKKSADRPENTLREFNYAIVRFGELHGDMSVVHIKRTHVLRFREALQEMPRRRSGKLRGATLPELVEWSKDHPGVSKVSAETVNKLLGAVQAVGLWARDNGLIPDDMPWSDPFSNMRLQTRKSTRQPWQTDELRRLFGSPIFTRGNRPRAGGGDAAFWLPLLALFTGARLNELAPLTAADITTDEATAIVCINIKEDPDHGRRLKTAGSARTVPVHTELVRIGFLRFTEQIRSSSGGNGRLFPLLKPGSKGGFGEAWSKWFGRYKRRLGIDNPASVFHSFRHGFKDSARAARISEDLHDALTGHAGPSIGRSYGAKDMVRRFGLATLADAVGRVQYPGLDLSSIAYDGTGDTRQHERNEYR
jgi:integrase